MGDVGPEALWEDIVLTERLEGWQCLGGRAP